MSDSAKAIISLGGLFVWAIFMLYMMTQIDRPQTDKTKEKETPPR